MRLTCIRFPQFLYIDLISGCIKYFILIAGFMRYIIKHDKWRGLIRW